MDRCPNTAQLEARPNLAAWAGRAEDALAVAVLLAMAGLPALEVVLRTFFATGVPGTSGYVQHLTLWVGFVGAMIAARSGRHLSLSTGKVSLPARLQPAAAGLASLASTAVAAGLCWAAFRFVQSELDAPSRIGGWLPVWMAEAILPAAFAVIALRFIVRAGGARERAIAALGVPVAALIGFVLDPLAPALVWPAIAVLIAAALVGAPIFVVLGGATLMLFLAAEVPAAAVTVETYRIVVSPSIPAIPLFTLTGCLLAAGSASERLVRLFRALVGWMPGGLAIATTLVCAFFTTFTGASGVTILALGGLLAPVLMKNGYPKRFSMGLVTATGSIGLLFPPSLAVILYAVVAHVPIPDLFRAAIVPGLIIIGAVCLFGVREGVRRETRRTFDAREAAALWHAKWEVLLPVLVIGGIFGGFTTLLEAAALSVVYVLAVHTLIRRDLHPTRDVPRVLVECATLIGGVFAILGVAMGLTNYMVDAQVPTAAAAWVAANVESRFVFLLALNVFLLIVGCLMDIFSAIVVVVPLILVIGEGFGIHPLHLGIIFLVNLELGYLTPPVGMNLFLSSFLFRRPLNEVYRDVLPFLAVLLAVLLLITYVPALTIGAG